MRFGEQKKHMIDFLFPIAVFFVFAASSLTVLILAANLYSKSAARSGDNYEARTTLAYVNEKIRQNDRDGSISIQSVDGTDCLSIHSIYNDKSYTTYIYAYEGMLKELFIKDGVDMNLKDGKDIMEAASFTMEEQGSGLFRFTTEGKNGKETVLVVSERSAP